MTARLGEQRKRRTGRVSVVLLTGVLHAVGLTTVAWIGFSSEPAVVAASTRNAALDPVRISRLDGGRSVAQSFEIPTNNLVRIDVLMDRGSEAPASAVRARIRRSLDGPDLREVSLQPADIPERGRVPIIFPIIERSAGLSYVLILDQPGASRVNAVSVLGAACDCLLRGRLLATRAGSDSDASSPDENDSPRTLDDPEVSTPPANPSGEQDVAMSIYYLPPPGTFSKLRVLEERLAHYKPAWLQVRWVIVFAAGAAVAYALLVASLLYHATAKSRMRAMLVVCACSLAIGVAVPVLFVTFG